MERLPIDATMGERIRYYRQVAGLTQKALAEKCGITESAIRNYELGNRMPDWETRRKALNSEPMKEYF